MDENRLKITTENSAEWLASAGYIFPTNEQELKKFNTIHGEIDPAITGLEVDPFKIIKNNKIATIKPIAKSARIFQNQHQLVARNLSSLPDRIVKRMNVKKDDEKDSEPDQSRDNNQMPD